MHTQETSRQSNAHEIKITPAGTHRTKQKGVDAIWYAPQSGLPESVLSIYGYSVFDTNRHNGLISIGQRQKDGVLINPAHIAPGEYCVFINRKAVSMPNVLFNALFEENL